VVDVVVVGAVVVDVVVVGAVVVVVELDVVVDAGTTGTICSLCEPIQLGPMTAA
jgi:hypothetical protein